MKAAAALLVVMMLKLMSNKVSMKPTGEDMDGEVDMDKDMSMSFEKNNMKADEAGVINRGCAGEIEEYNEMMSKGIQSLSYDDLYDLLKYNRTDFVLVDVRTPQEFADGHIPASFLVTITNGKFEEHVDFRQILCGRKFIVLYCRSGRRALVAANLLKSKVPTKLYSGSWIEWSTENPKNIVPYVRKRM
uniref:putative thiosulfate sulfurtransferase, mitochondrial n=1 Tax=Styela clava TaxID=7725 RepID=UPI001939D326|nr:putative thiosulfate sulfurtransferase, mitochondrial [Styela clava]